MIYIYRSSSKSADALAKAIKDEGSEVVRLKDMMSATPGHGDLVVNWGAYYERWPWSGARILNKRIVGDKLAELRKIAAAEVPTPEIRTSKPSSGKWIARRHNHFEANDVRANLEYGDFYSRWLDVDKEFRFHIFMGSSLRQQYKKAVKEDAHPWIRSWATGWDWKNGGDGTDAMREAAKKAVKACGLDFGAVDVGRLRGGGFVVLEINTSPGFDPQGSTCYEWAKAIIAEHHE